MIGRFQDSRKAATAWITLAVVLPLYVVSYLLSLTRPEIQRIPPFSFDDALWEGTYVTLSVVGALVAARRPANAIGWVLLATGGSASIPYVSFEYAVLSLLTASRLPGGEVAAWLSVWSWAPSVALFVVALLLFPSGGLPSPRWRWVVWVVAVPAFLIALLSAVGTWDRRGPLLLVGLADAGVGWLERVVALLFSVVLLAALIAMGSLIVRYRRADSVERLQLKWVVLAATLMAAGLIMGETFAQAGPYHAISELIGAPIWFPIAAGIAITRYRLYDFDRIISRTVSYLLLVGLLGATFVGLVTGVSSLLPTDDSRAVAGSTLVVAAMFNPLRRRVQDVVDRRFDRSRYDVERVIESFAGSLRARMDPHAVMEGLVTVVSDTMQPAAVGIWVKETAK